MRVSRRSVGPSIPIHFHGHNDFGLATACACGWRSGAAWIHCTLDRMGERAGNANIAQVPWPSEHFTTSIRIFALKELEQLQSVCDKLPATNSSHGNRWSARISSSGKREPSAAQFHIPEAIEPYSADLVSTTRGIVMGKKSGLASVRLKCRTRIGDCGGQYPTC